MKTLFLVLLFLPIIAFTQVSTTLNQTFVMDDVGSISIDVKNSKQVTVEKIQGTRIIVETKVRISTNNLTLLDFLAKQGRYNLTISTNSSTSTLKLTELKSKNPIIIKGAEAVEDISYTVYIPSKINQVQIFETPLK